MLYHKTNIVPKLLDKEERLSKHVDSIFMVRVVTAIIMEQFFELDDFLEFIDKAEAQTCV